MTNFSPLPRYDAHHARDLYRQIATEAEVLGPMMASPPWVVTRADRKDDDAGVRAAFRRWSPTSGPPSPAMEGAVHRSIRQDAPFRSLSEDDQEAGVARLAAVLHLVALGWQSDGARPMESVGAACAGTDPAKALISNTRFARLLTSPPEPALRVQALGRAFRQFRKAGVAVDPDGARDLLRFLFSTEPEETVRRWAGDYFRIVFPGDHPANASDSTLTPTL